jgi:hypothetical protein
MQLSLRCGYEIPTERLNNNKNNSMAFSPQANYTDRWPPLDEKVNANFCG